MSFIRTILLCCFILAAANLAYAKEWHGIVPLHSTREDVERQLGPAKDSTKEHVSNHETEKEVVLVQYSTGLPCSGGINIWRVPRGTVLNIIVHPKTGLSFSDLHLDESKYKKTNNEGHGPPYFYYTDGKEGMQFEVTQGKVMSITYFSTAKDDNHLRCPLPEAKRTYAKEWRGIVPLHSTRADVERLLGPAKDATKEHVSEHETENEEVTVEYSTGPPCGTGWPGVWRVPRGTVINIIVHPKREFRFSDLHIDESKYKKTDTEGHGPLYFYYTNEEEGLQYEVTQGRVMSITYSSTAKDDNNLRCPPPKAKPANSKEWRGIVPLHSTRADVERLLGPAKDARKEHVSEHETENEEVTVEYSTGPPCGTGWPGVWRVPRGTVINIIVHPKRELRFSDLHIDESKYKKTDTEGHGPLYFYYTDEKEGIQFEVTQGLVMATIYFHAAKDNYLRCPVPEAKTSHAKEWNGIVPLQSSRADVERKLGRPNEPTNQYASIYKTENEVVFVLYASGSPCGTDGPDAWKVPGGTVISVTVRSNTELRFTDLHLDESKYKKTDNEGHGPPYFYYTDDKEGIQFEVTQGRVMGITYFPAATDNHLRCSVTPKPPCSKSSSSVNGSN